MPLSSFRSIWLSVREAMSFKVFQDDRHGRSWLPEWNEFSNSESQCHPDTFSQVSAKSDFLSWVRCRLKNFKMAAILDIKTERIEQFWISMSPRYLPSSISSIQISVREMSFKEFQDGRHLGYRNGTNWASAFPCRPETSHQVSAQSDFPFRRCHLKNFKMASILVIETERI